MGIRLILKWGGGKLDFFFWLKPTGGTSREILINFVWELLTFQRGDDCVETAGLIQEEHQERMTGWSSEAGEGRGKEDGLLLHPQLQTYRHGRNRKLRAEDLAGASAAWHKVVHISQECLSPAGN